MRILYILFISYCCSISWSKNNDLRLLSYQEALIGVAQASGFFDRSISADFTLENITYLFSNYGISVNIIKLWGNQPFTEKDMAKMLGQIYILHRGELRENHAHIELPNGYKHWIEFCDVHGLEYGVVYHSLLDFFIEKR